MDSTFLFFFSAIGVFNGIVLSGYLWLTAKNRFGEQRLLVLLVLLLCLRAGVSCLYFFDRDFPAWLIQLGLSANLLSGIVMLHFLMRYNGENRSNWHIWVPFFIIVLFGLLFPFSSNPKVWDFKIRYVFHFLLTCYVVVSAWKLRSIVSRWGSQHRLSNKTYWSSVVWAATILVYFGFALSLFTTYILGPLWFSVVFYGVIVLSYQQVKKGKVPFAMEAYQDRKIAQGLAGQWQGKVEQLMAENRLFTQQDLRLDDVAVLAGMARHDLSQLLNDNLGKTFNQFVNEYRADYTCQLLREKPNYSLEAIALEAGFKSKSTFYTFFKKQYAQTPAQFKKALAEGGSNL